MDRVKFDDICKICDFNGCDCWGVGVVQVLVLIVGLVLMIVVFMVFIMINELVYVMELYLVDYYIVFLEVL